MRYSLIATMFYSAAFLSAAFLAHPSQSQTTEAAKPVEPRASDVERQQKRYVMQSTTGFTDANGYILTVGRGQALLAGGLILTSNSIVTISKTSVQVGESTFSITNATKFCLADGKGAAVTSFAAGDDVTVTSTADETVAMTLRKGLAQDPMILGGSYKPINIECK